MSERKKLIVFASGTEQGGGSGFKQLARYAAGGGASYEVCAVVSHHEHGGVRIKADELSIPFEYFPRPHESIGYRDLVTKYRADYAALSGWMRFVEGLDPARTINIHPSLLSFRQGRFGGKGMYGHKVHEAVHEALHKGELDQLTNGKDGVHAIAHSGFTMHFVTNRYDDPDTTFAEVRVAIDRSMSPDTIQDLVKKAEHMWQPILTDMVTSGKIRYEDAKVVAPIGYGLMPK